MGKRQRRRMREQGIISVQKDSLGNEVTVHEEGTDVVINTQSIQATAAPETETTPQG